MQGKSCGEITDQWGKLYFFSGEPAQKRDKNPKIIHASNID
jgi:hypothetical protein